MTWLTVAGDPGRIYQEGLAARHAVEEGRQRVAELVGGPSAGGGLHQRCHRGHRHRCPRRGQSGLASGRPGRRALRRPGGGAASRTGHLRTRGPPGTGRFRSRAGCRRRRHRAGPRAVGQPRGGNRPGGAAGRVAVPPPGRAGARRRRPGRGARAGGLRRIGRGPPLGQCPQVRRTTRRRCAAGPKGPAASAAAAGRRPGARPPRRARERTRHRRVRGGGGRAVSSRCTDQRGPIAAAASPTGCWQRSPPWTACTPTATWPTGCPTWCAWA